MYLFVLFYEIAPDFLMPKVLVRRQDVKFKQFSMIQDETNFKTLTLCLSLRWDSCLHLKHQTDACERDRKRY